MTIKFLFSLGRFGGWSLISVFHVINYVNNTTYLKYNKIEFKCKCYSKYSAHPLIYRTPCP